MDYRQELIDNIFTSADNSLNELRHRKTKKCYDYIQKSPDNKRLTLVLGDSWTFGFRLIEEADETVKDLDYFRVTNTFGYLLSEHFNSDYLNISVPAINNTWLARKLVDFCKINDSLDYSEIKVVIVFTEYGREFHTDFDFESRYGQAYSFCNSAKDVATALSKFISDDLLHCCNDKINLLVSTTYVSNLYDGLSSTDKSWLEILSNKNLDPCLIIGSWVIPKFENLPEYNKNINKSSLKEELLTLANVADQVYSVIRSTGFNHREGYGHPKVQGHKMFYEYLLTYF